MAKKNKMTKCKVCGAEIAKSAKVCPNCGAKNKKPIYKRVWFWLLIVLVIIIIAVGASSGDGDNDSSSSGSSGNQSSTKQTERHYKAVNASTLQNELDDNAAAASDKYKGKYLAVSGPFNTIDSDGGYMTISTGEYEIIDISCNFTKDSQLKKAKSLHKGQNITVKGKMTDVGEVLGYTMDIDSFKVNE